MVITDYRPMKDDDGGEYQCSLFYPLKGLKYFWYDQVRVMLDKEKKLIISNKKNYQCGINCKKFYLSGSTFRITFHCFEETEYTCELLFFTNVLVIRCYDQFVNLLQFNLKFWMKLISVIFFLEWRELSRMSTTVGM